MNKAVYAYIPAVIISLSVIASLATGAMAIAYIAIMYWTIFRSDFVPISLVLLLGLVIDALSGNVMGQQAFIFLVLMGVTYLDRAMLLHQDFQYIWFHVCGVLVVALLGNLFINWSLSSAEMKYVYVYDTVLSIVLFPLFAKLMFPLYNKLNKI